METVIYVLRRQTATVVDYQQDRITDVPCIVAFKIRLKAGIKQNTVNMVQYKVQVIYTTEGHWQAINSFVMNFIDCYS